MALERTYGTLTRAGDRWVISELEPHVTIRLKHLFPRIPKAQPAPFEFATDSMTCADLEWFMHRYPLRAAGKDLKAIDRGVQLFEKTQAEMERILAPDYTPPVYRGLRPGCEIRGYQAQAVEIIARSKGLLLGDEVGLGKTFAACGMFLLQNALPFVVVCYGHLQAQWCGVIENFTTLRTHLVNTTKPYSLPPADGYIFRWSQLAKWADAFATFKPRSVCYDEIQELRSGVGTPANPIQRGIAASRLSALCEMRLGASATPIYNYGNEIYNVMQFLRPEVLGDRGDFMREWCPTAAVKDPKALGTYLREQHAFLRRTKGDVGKEMPPVNRVVHVIDHDAEKLDSVDAIAHALAQRATTGEFTDRGQAVRELDMLIRHETGIAKAPYVADFVRMIASAGEPVVLAGWHRDVYDIWREKLADLEPAMYTGSESNVQKAKEVKRFVAGETDILILSLRSGAGLDGLQKRSSTFVFGELDWSPGVHHQCIGRLDREGQEHYPVNAIFLVANDGSDPPMMEVLGLKASEASAIVDPHLGVQRTHSDASHLQSLVRRYLDRKPAKKRIPAREGVLL